jgi:hypothetical protein
MRKMGKEHVVITLAEIEAMPRGAIAIQTLSDEIHLRWVDEETAERLAREEGGLPSEKAPKTCLTDGSPVTPDHREIDPKTGMQKEYVCLCPEERAKGFVRPVRTRYKHLKCGGVTSMHQALAETYARNPRFYSGTYCAICQAHFPVGPEGEFVWLDKNGAETTEKVGT